MATFDPEVVKLEVVALEAVPFLPLVAELPPCATAPNAGIADSPAATTIARVIFQNEVRMGPYSWWLLRVNAG
jgi:hypothetical protein